MDNYKNYSVDFAKMGAFDFPLTEEPFLLSVFKDNVTFDFLIRLKNESNKAIIFGSGAYDATSELTPPIFQRHKWMKHFDESLIFYNDPTLYLGQINMGWGFGFEDRHYLAEISEILVVILDRINVHNSKSLFYGSSAGGFMSLMLGGLVRGSKVLVNNPQTIVWNYYDRHVNAMFSHAHPRLNREEIIADYPDRLNVLEFYKKIKYVPEIKYLQNVASERDLTHHLQPLILGLKDLEDDWYSCPIEISLYANKELGHSPLKLQESVQYINEAVKQL